MLTASSRLGIDSMMSTQRMMNVSTDWPSGHRRPEPAGHEAQGRADDQADGGGHDAVHQGLAGRRRPSASTCPTRTGRARASGRRTAPARWSVSPAPTTPREPGAYGVRSGANDGDQDEDRHDDRAGDGGRVAADPPERAAPEADAVDLLPASRGSRRPRGGSVMLIG